MILQSDIESEEDNPKFDDSDPCYSADSTSSSSYTESDSESLFFILSVTRHLICGSNLNWLLNLNLIYEALWTGVRSGLLISMLVKLSWFCLTGLITMGLLM